MDRDSAVISGDPLDELLDDLVLHNERDLALVGIEGAEEAAVFKGRPTETSPVDVSVAAPNVLQILKVSSDVHPLAILRDLLQLGRRELKGILSDLDVLKLDLMRLLVLN